MENRKARVIVQKAGGNAGKGSMTYKISLPTTWIKSLNITPEDREVTLSFDGKRIVIEKSE